jgi:hypothetical protein
MKRKVKKFNAGGLAAPSVTPGFGATGQVSGGIAGMQNSLQDISAGSGQIENGLRTIRGQSSGSGRSLLDLGSQQTSAGLYQNLIGGNRANVLPMQDAANYALQNQARTFKKGGAVKAKAKASSPKKGMYQRGDGIATKGKTRGRMA